MSPILNTPLTFSSTLYLTTLELHPHCATASKQCNTGCISTVFNETREDGSYGCGYTSAPAYRRRHWYCRPRQVNLTTSHSIRSLGVIVDDNNTLSFNEHVNSVCKSANFHLCVTFEITTLKTPPLP